MSDATTTGAAPAQSLPYDLQVAFATAVSRLLELHDYHTRHGRRAIANDFANAVTSVAALRKAMLAELAKHPATVMSAVAASAALAANAEESLA